MGGFGHERQNYEGKEGTPRRAEHGVPQSDPLVSHLIALQRSVGNAAVSRLVAGSPSLQRQPVESGVPTRPSPPGSQADALAAMTRTAWEEGVLKREHEAAALLTSPRAGKLELRQADVMLSAAMGAANSIGLQFATLAPERLTKARSHEKDIAIDRAEMIPLMQKVTPGDIAANITDLTVPMGKRTMAEITAPLPAGAGAGGAAPTAPEPAPTRPSGPAGTP